MVGLQYYSRWENLIHFCSCLHVVVLASCFRIRWNGVLSNSKVTVNEKRTTEQFLLYIPSLALQQGPGFYGVIIVSWDMGREDAHGGKADGCPTAARVGSLFWVCWWGTHFVSIKSRSVGQHTSQGISPKDLSWLLKAGCWMGHMATLGPPGSQVTHCLPQRGY